MVLRIYNTLSREKEEFIPLHGNRVNMFVCGPTVYDFSHLGHARTYVAYDVITKYLRFKGYSVFYLMNITDVDDKIINRAAEENRDPIELARTFEEHFVENMNVLGVDSVNLYARASEFVSEIIAQARTLIEKGFAYETETGVYYNIAKFDGYGKLSHQKPEDLEKHRVEPDPTKKNVADFSLWKKRRNTNELSWDSPWGRGRPGWHIEDTAITTTQFGPSYDLHGGAVELIFPHHEAEIAQAEAATGIKPLVKYWTHTGLLTVNDEKMSKSLKNFITIREAVGKFQPEALRLFFVSKHYRSPIDFNESDLEQASHSLDTLYNAIRNIKNLRRRLEIEEADKTLMRKATEVRQEFIEAMDDDFNTPVALSTLFTLAKEINKFVSEQDAVEENTRTQAITIYKELGRIFGILQKEDKIESGELDEKLLNLILGLREQHRKNGKWEAADQNRIKLGELGIVVEDTSEGTRWRFVKSNS